MPWSRFNYNTICCGIFILLINDHNHSLIKAKHLLHQNSKWPSPVLIMTWWDWDDHSCPFGMTIYQPSWLIIDLCQSPYRNKTQLNEKAASWPNGDARLEPRPLFSFYNKIWLVVPKQLVFYSFIQELRLKKRKVGISLGLRACIRV